MGKLSRKQTEYINKMREYHSIDRNDFILTTVDEVLNDKNKYHIYDLKSLEQNYLLTIIKIISKYDFRLLLIEYRLHVTSKYNPVYYHEHIELEILIGLLVSYGKEIRMVKLNEIISNRLINNDVLILEETLRKFNAIFYIKNMEINKDFNHTEFFEFISSPEMMLQFKTKNVRNEGSGSQYLGYINDILQLLVRKNRFQNMNDYSSVIEGFITLINTPIESKKSNMENFIKLLKISIKTIFNIKKINVLKLMDFFCKDKIFAATLIEMYLNDVYNKEEIYSIFSNNEFILSNTIKINSIKVDNVTLNNPIWKTPFIEFSNNKLLYPIHSLPLTYAEEYITRNLSDSDRDLYYYTKTNDFIEQKVNNILSKYSELSVYHQIKYDYNGTQYETDFLVIHNSYAIVIEVKGHHLSDSAKRGSSVKIDNHLNKTVETAAKQANQLKSIIEKRQSDNTFLYKSKKILIDFSKISEVITLSISFEWLIFFTTGMTLLRKNYEIPKGHVHCSLSEFEHLVDILDTEEQFITYLLKRQYLEEDNINIRTDELDLITYFVQYALNFEFDKYGVAYLVREFDHSTNLAYFTNKYSLNQDKKDKIYDQILGDTSKVSFISSDFINRHLIYLRRYHPIHSKLIGYFQCIPRTNQLQIESTVKNDLTGKKITQGNRHTIFTLDPYSPKLILTLSDGKPVDNILLAITRELNMKKATKHGYISVIYDNSTSEFNVLNVTHFKGTKDKYLKQI